MVCERSTAVSGCLVRTRGIEHTLRDLIAQGSCCIAQPHGQHRIAPIVKRITSSYIQNLIMLATRGKDVESIDLSIIHYIGTGEEGKGKEC